MKKLFLRAIIAVLVVASIGTVAPVSKASASQGYGIYCGAGTWNYASSSGRLYAYRKVGTNNFCFLMINPYWGTKKYMTITVTTSGLLMYDAGPFYYYAGPKIRTLGAGMCSSIQGTVANLDYSNQSTYNMYFCNSSPTP